MKKFIAIILALIVILPGTSVMALRLPFSIRPIFIFASSFMSIAIHHNTTRRSLLPKHLRQFAGNMHRDFNAYVSRKTRTRNGYL